MKIVSFTKHIPKPDHSSGELRYFSMLKLLAEENDVDICVTSYGKWMKEYEKQRYTEVLENAGIHVLPLEEGIVEKALSNIYDMGLFEFYWMANELLPSFRKAFPEAAAITDSVDIHFHRESIQEKLGQISIDQVNRTKKAELNAYKNSDATIVVSRDDEKFLRKHGVDPVFFIPNIVETKQRRSGGRKPVMIFVGGYLWPPNVDAVVWFIENIWDEIISKRPDAEFRIIGSNPTEDIMKFEGRPGIKVVGYQESLEPHYHEAAVSVAPLRYGGGMKGKINEAMSYGVPVVATSVGAQGFNAQSGKEMLISDQPGEFARDVISLLNDQELQEKIGFAGQNLNSRICDFDVIRAELRRMLDYASEINNSGRKKLLFWDKFKNIFK